MVAEQGGRLLADDRSTRVIWLTSGNQMRSWLIPILTRLSTSVSLPGCC